LEDIVEGMPARALNVDAIGCSIGLLVVEAEFEGCCGMGFDDEGFTVGAATPPGGRMTLANRPVVEPPDDVVCVGVDDVGTGTLGWWICVGVAGVVIGTD
jgi:hypothetical protein